MPIKDQCLKSAFSLPSTIILNYTFSYNFAFPSFSSFCHTSTTQFFCSSLQNTKSKTVISSSSSTNHFTTMLVQFFHLICLFSHLQEFWISQPDTLAQLFLPYFMHPAVYVYRLTVKRLLPQQLIIFQALWDLFTSLCQRGTMFFEWLY